MENMAMKTIMSFAVLAFLQGVSISSAARADFEEEAARDAKTICIWLTDMNRCNAAPDCVWDVAEGRCERNDNGWCYGITDINQCMNTWFCKWDEEDGRCETK
jgi:hypothetical protein